MEETSFQDRAKYINNFQRKKRRVQRGWRLMEPNTLEVLQEKKTN